MKLKKDGTPKMSGGKRENSGRKKQTNKYIKTYYADKETHEELSRIVLNSK